jgi:hypothetical protein
MRVTVYVEGGRELGLSSASSAAPNEPLVPDALGPAHILIQRIVGGSPDFRAPLRTPTGRIAKGSELRSGATLPKLLTWVSRDNAPDLAILFVDEDGDNQRKRGVEQIVKGRANSHPPVLVAVPAPEFEIWLIADYEAAGRVLGRSVGAPPSQTSLSPQQAKTILDGWLAHLPLERKREARVAIARQCSLDVLSSRCRCFEDFRKELIVAGVIRE